MRISDWSSDVCSSDLIRKREPHHCNIMTDAEFSCPVLVISMADAVERRAAFSARAARAGIPWRFVAACSDLAEGLRYDAAAVARNEGSPLPTGTLGCYPSADRRVGTQCFSHFRS